jgi:hypothetical protein
MLIRHETGKHIEDVDDTLFMIDDLEGGTPTAWLAGEVGECSLSPAHSFFNITQERQNFSIILPMALT